jgi:hypothetical protein
LTPAGINHGSRPIKSSEDHIGQFPPPRQTSRAIRTKILIGPRQKPTAHPTTAAPMHRGMALTSDSSAAELSCRHRKGMGQCAKCNRRSLVRCSFAEQRQFCRAAGAPWTGTTCRAPQPLSTCRATATAWLARRLPGQPPPSLRVPLENRYVYQPQPSPATKGAPRHEGWRPEPPPLTATRSVSGGGSGRHYRVVKGARPPISDFCSGRLHPSPYTTYPWGTKKTSKIPRRRWANAQALLPAQRVSSSGLILLMDTPKGQVGACPKKVRDQGATLVSTWHFQEGVYPSNHDAGSGPHTVFRSLP